MEYDVFVSYSRRDSDIVEKVINELTRHNISVWIDKDGVESGDAFKSVIVKAIKNANVFLFFSSKSSNESPWTVKEVMGDNPSHFKGEMLPVENVSWFDCQDFVLKLSQMSGKHFRLPTEAEWEFAARGGNKSRHTKYSGSDNLDEVGWYNENGEGRTHLPGEKKPNELGLYDMSGNVWEWVQDWKGDYSEEHQTDPKGLPIGDERICRGGGWNRERDRARVSYRGDDLPDLRYCTLGLRVVMEN